MVKPIWTSWKHYAKKLEGEIAVLKDQKVYKKQLDYLINKHLSFPSIAECMSYLKAKAEINEKISSLVLWSSDHVTPQKLTHIEIELMNRVKRFEDRLKDYQINEKL